MFQALVAERPFLGESMSLFAKEEERTVKLPDREIRAVIPGEPFFRPHTGSSVENNLVCVDLHGNLLWRCQPLPVMQGATDASHQFMNVRRHDEQHVSGYVWGGFRFVIRIADGVIVQSTETR
jgi:hypothetical protein